MGDVVEFTANQRQDDIEQLMDHLDCLGMEDRMDGFFDAMIGTLQRRLDCDVRISQALDDVTYWIDIGEHDDDGRYSFTDVSILVPDEEVYAEAIKIRSQPYDAGNYANVTQHLQPIADRIKTHAKCTREYHYLILLWLFDDLLEAGFVLNAQVVLPNRPYSWLRFISNETIVEIQY